MLTARKTLGLAITNEGITAVEIGAVAGRRTILHAAALDFTKELSLEHPEPLGKALHQILHSNHISASRCVVGLPASSLVAREKLLPPMEAGTLRGVLSIATEREFASAGELVFDYSQSTLEAGLSALLVAAPRKSIESILVMAGAAGLSVAAVTSSAAGLATATKGAVGAEGRLVLCLLPRGVELAAQTPDGLRLIRFLSVRTDSPDAMLDNLAGELRRVLSLVSPGDASLPPRPMVLWNASALASSALQPLGERLALPLTICDGAADLDVADASATPMAGECAQAAALAVCAAGPAPLDFIHSRLAPPAKRRIGRRVMWGAIAAAAVLAVGIFLAWDLNASQQEVVDLQNQLAGMKNFTAQAKELVERESFARSWYDRPKFLDLMREITMAFPAEGKIWATHLEAKEDLQGVTLSGKAVDQQAVLEMLDHLKANPRIADAKPQQITEGTGASHEASFAVKLSLRGAK